MSSSLLHTMGVAHPPGYPLFTLLGKLATYFAWFPYSSIGFRVNMVSVVCDTLAAVLLFSSVARWSGSIAGGILSAGLFAFCPSVWDTAIVAEVFGLNNLIVTLLLYMAVRFYEDRKPRWIYLSAFVFGLGMSNQYICVLVGGIFLPWLIWQTRAEFKDWRRLSLLVGLFLAGLLPYIYLPIASSHVPLIAWGDQTTWSGFWNHIARNDYGTFSLIASNVGSGFLAELGFYLKYLLKDGLYLGCALALFGIIACVRRESWKGVGGLSLITWMAGTLFFNSLNNFPLADPESHQILCRFWQQPNLLVFAWVGLGLAALEQRFLRGRWQAATIALGVCIFALQAGLNFSNFDRSGDNVPETYARAVMRRLVQGSIVLTSGDVYVNGLRYLQAVEGYRKDLAVIDDELFQTEWLKRNLAFNHPEIRFPGRFYRPRQPDGFDFKTFIEANQPRLVYYNSQLDPRDQVWRNIYLGFPLHYLNEVVKTDVTFDAKGYSTLIKEAIDDFKPENAYRFQPGTWEQNVIASYWGWNDASIAFLFKLAIQNNDLEAVKLAAGLMETLISVGGPGGKDTPAILYKNLGKIYQKAIELGRRDAAPYLLRTWRKYVELGPQDDPDMETIRKVLSANGY